MPASIEKSMNVHRRREIRTLTRERKTKAAAALRELTALRKQASKIVASHKTTDAILARRIAIVQSRLG